MTRQRRSSLVVACDKFLSDQHMVLFGQHWDISDPKQRADAAEWLAAQIKAVAEYMPKPKPKPKDEKQLCFAPKTPTSHIECEQALGHKGPHAGRGAKDRWFVWV